MKEAFSLMNLVLFEESNTLEVKIVFAKPDWGRWNLHIHFFLPYHITISREKSLYICIIHNINLNYSIL